MGCGLCAEFRAPIEPLQNWIAQSKSHPGRIGPLLGSTCNDHLKMRPSSTLFTLVVGLVAGVSVAQTGNVTSLLGTWSSGSGAVTTGSVSHHHTRSSRNTREGYGTVLLGMGRWGGGEGVEVDLWLVVWGLGSVRLGGMRAQLGEGELEAS